MSNPLTKRYDFAFLFDVQDGNPNGDPDAGNLPRIDSETGYGLVTDVCLKRKVRNYVQIVSGGKSPNDIYIKEKAVLGRAHVAVFQELGIQLGEESRKPIPAEILPLMEDFTLPEGLSVVEGDVVELVVAADADLKIIKQEIKDEKPHPSLKKFLEDSLKGVKARKPTATETDAGRSGMCSRYFDVRTFGAVMSLKSAPNCGQVRGPIQLTFARSVDPVVTFEHSITRMAVATEAEAEKQSGDNRTMGRKYTIPYGLYVAHGFVSAHLAAQTGFSDDDLELFWKALADMFEHDRSAARGLMSARGLYVFEHDSALGNAPAHALFEKVIVTRAPGTESKPPRSFGDYTVEVQEPLPLGVRLIRKIG